MPPSTKVEGQKRRHSITEAVLSTLIGFWIAYSANIIVLPLFGFELTASTNFWLTSFFTAISVIRSYIVRRWFNWLHVKEIL